MEIYDFVNYMLATLANKTKSIDLKEPNRKYACLPFHYKQIIECILTAKNGWHKRFSRLIDINEYFDCQAAWEDKLVKNILLVTSNLGKEIEWDLYWDFFVIPYSKEEVENIIGKYSGDEELDNIMCHFVNLLQDYIYTRGYQRQFHDYFARAVQTMKEIENRDENATIDDILKSDEEQPQKPGFMKKLGTMFKK